MKLDLSRPVFQKRRKAEVWPTKATINLAPPRTGLQWTPRLAVATVLGAVLLCLFVKVAVVDVLGAAARSAAEVSAAAERLAKLQESNEDYVGLQLQVARYGAGGLSADERALVPRDEVLDLLDATVGARTDVQSVTVAGPVVEVRFANAALADVSGVVAALESSPLVESVQMSAADAKDGATVLSSVEVVLASPQVAPSGEGAPDA